MENTNQVITIIDNDNVEITTQQPAPIPTVQTYNRQFLLNQIISIQASQDDFDNARQTEIANVNSLLALFPEILPPDAPLSTNSER